MGAERITAAFLMLWASLEAFARSEMPGMFARPQTPGQVVSTLATESHFTPGGAGRQQSYRKVRNAPIHGDLTALVTTADPTDLSNKIEAVMLNEAA